MREMARIIKPGGVLALATEYVLSGPPHEETFQPEEIDALVREVSQLRLQMPEPGTGGARNPRDELPPHY